MTQPPFPSTSNTSPVIGVMDSGVGGLSVLQALQAQLTHGLMLYYADTAHGPYGDKSPDWITLRSLQIARWLMAQGAQALVVACNTATLSAISHLRAALTIPVVGIEPAIKPAAALTRTGVVGVLGTSGTIQSKRVEELVTLYAQHTQVLMQACPGLACAVESGDLHAKGVREMLAHWLDPMLAAGMDTLVLGCTHYRFLTPVLQSLTGGAVTLIHPEDAVARQLIRQLPASERTGQHGAVQQPQLFCSGDLSRFAARARALLDTSDLAIAGCAVS